MLSRGSHRPASPNWSNGPETRAETPGPRTAVFPVEVPRRLIRMYSFWGETVLDPFLGTGTTSLAADLEGRNSVGYEINREFRGLIREKLGVTAQVELSTRA